MANMLKAADVANATSTYLALLSLFKLPSLWSNLNTIGRASVNE